MRYPLLCLGAWLLWSCAATGGRTGTPARPATLRVDFDSATAAAQLRWHQATGQDFLAYQIERAAGPGQPFAPLVRIEALAETTYVDSGLQGNTSYRYRLLTHLGSEGRASRPGPAIEGGIHCLVNSWKLPAGFLPTRLVVDHQGAISVVGAGAGRVERFDRAGHPLGSWTFAAGPLACLETATLEAPALALDRYDNLYIACNLLEKGKAPRALWTKFDGRGRRVWTRPLEGLFARYLAIDPQGQVFIESLSQLHQFTAEGEWVAQYPLPPLMTSGFHFWKSLFAVLVDPLEWVEGSWQAPRLVAYTGPERAAVSMAIGRDPLSAEDRGNGLLLRPCDFAVDESSSRAFVVDAGQSCIAVFRHSKFLTSWGREGAAGGEFRFAGRAAVVDDLAAGTTTERQVMAGGIARDQEGYLYVADTFNNRIQKFSP